MTTRDRRRTRLGTSRRTTIRLTGRIIVSARGDDQHISNPVYREMMHALLAAEPDRARENGWTMLDTSDDPVETIVDRVVMNLEPGRSSAFGSLEGSDNNAFGAPDSR